MTRHMDVNEDYELWKHLSKECRKPNMNCYKPLVNILIKSTIIRSIIVIYYVTSISSSFHNMTSGIPAEELDKSIIEGLFKSTKGRRKQRKITSKRAKQSR